MWLTFFCRVHATHGFTARTVRYTESYKQISGTHSTERAEELDAKDLRCVLVMEGERLRYYSPKEWKKLYATKLASNAGGTRLSNHEASSLCKYSNENH